MQRRTLLEVVLLLAWASGSARAQTTATLPPGAALPAGAIPISSPLIEAKRTLAGKNFLQAKGMFAALVKGHPDSVEARLGEADAELGLREYETAELEYRRVVAAQPELWAAHKNLVIVEAALGRWGEFDGERTVLRLARERGAPGISARESDVIDSFTVRGQRWIVREYFEPVGRSQTRYNFEHFSPDGKAEEYISLESADAAKAVVPGGAVSIGTQAAATTAPGKYALNWYTGKSHGMVHEYATEPTYERTRSDVIKWLRTQTPGALR